MVQLNEKGYEKMSNELEKSWLATNVQLEQLMQVMNEITARPKLLKESFELSSNRIIGRLQKQIDKMNVLDHSDLIDDLYEAQLEIKYLVNYAKHVLTTKDNLEAS
jgi:hypothetical protein